MPRKPSETVQLKLRFPERLRIRIEAEAKKNERSMNAEIVHRLEQSFEGDDRADLLKTVASEAAQTASRLTAKAVREAVRRARGISEEDFRSARPVTVTLTEAQVERLLEAAKANRTAKSQTDTAVATNYAYAEPKEQRTAKPQRATNAADLPGVRKR
jgi:Arc-like DNA binding domain